MLSSSQTNPKLGGNRGRKKEKAIGAVPGSKPTTFLKDQLSFSHFLQLSERSRPQNEKLMTTPHPHPLSLSLTLSFLPSLLPLSLWPSCLLLTWVIWVNAQIVLSDTPPYTLKRGSFAIVKEILWVFLDETLSDCVTWVEEKWRAAAVHISSESLRSARLRLRLPQ